MPDQNCARVLPDFTQQIVQPNDFFPVRDLPGKVSLSKINPFLYLDVVYIRFLYSNTIVEAKIVYLFLEGPGGDLGSEGVPHFGQL